MYVSPCHPMIPMDTKRIRQIVRPTITIQIIRQFGWCVKVRKCEDAKIDIRSLCGTSMVKDYDQTTHIKSILLFFFTHTRTVK